MLGTDVGVNLTRSGSRTVASIGALSADDSGHSGNDPVLGAVLRTGEIGDALPWLRLLIGFDVIFLTLGVLVFDWVIEI